MWAVKRRRTQIPKPTAGEWEILEVLWQLGPATVRQVHEALQRKRPLQYTTTLKLMQIMAEKGLVARDESQRAHRYRPMIARQETQARLVDELVQRVFAGSAASLVQAAISGRKASREELAKIRRTLEQYEGGRNERR
jgi:predicted transcriptional regulator